MDGRNVFGEKLAVCSLDPMTGFYRNGCCDTDSNDQGLHLVCAQVTEEFLRFSKSKGNNLITPFPLFNFPGLKPGDRWCLCVTRWKEALNAGVAPPVILAATHEAVLQYVSLEQLQKHAIDFIDNN
ncbi:MAG: DUF2237 family protein [Microcoleaceae cyanobacterium]